MSKQFANAVQCIEQLERDFAQLKERSAHAAQAAENLNRVCEAAEESIKAATLDRDTAVQAVAAAEDDVSNSLVALHGFIKQS